MSRAGESGEVKLPALTKSSSAAAIGHRTSADGVSSESLPRVSSQVSLKRPSSSEASPSSDLVTVRFRGNPHGLAYSGLRWDGTRVTASVLQAWMLGVRPGWTIVKVAGRAVHDSDEIEEQLQLVSSNKKYEISFQKGQANFGTEAKMREDRVTRNVGRLEKTFVFQGNIERTEHRGITYSQLEQVFNFAEDHCEQWHDTSPSKLFGQMLQLHSLNHHHINAWVILPATKKDDCAFVEMLTGQAQPPAWFVSHWWGQPITQLMGCVNAHRATRGLSDDKPYWISAYALRQHVVRSEITHDTKKTSFYKALETARFNMLLVLDSDATPFIRIWCTFEETLCFDWPGTPLDISIWYGAKAEIITQGLTEEEDKMELHKRGEGIKAKLAREATFPIEIAEAGMEAELQKGDASVEEDRGRILNSILGRDLEADPLDYHPRYAETNARLHALFAAALFIRSSIGEATRSDAVQQRLAKVSQLLRGDTWRKSLDMHVEGLDTPGLGLLVDSLPPNLHELKLRLKSSRLGDRDMKVLAKGLPKFLTSLTLDLTQCESIGDKGLEALESCIDFHGTAVNFKLVGTRVNKEAQEWYAAEGFKMEEDCKYGSTIDVARALGVTPCKDPAHCRRFRKRVVPVATTLARVLGADDEFRARVAFKALNRFSGYVLPELSEIAGDRLRTMEAEVEAKEAEHKAERHAKEAERLAREQAEDEDEGLETTE
mmetsp:Transcript_62889/g.138466  ORF Transcript_62889/g.138466 Transcript_62889/m.138466 type:complete len:716 (-) Transcript_62889:87-2234(-)